MGRVGATRIVRTGTLSLRSLGGKMVTYIRSDLDFILAQIKDRGRSRALRAERGPGRQAVVHRRERLDPGQQHQLGPAHRRRDLQQPDPGPDRLGLRRPAVPGPDGSGVPAGGSGDRLHSHPQRRAGDGRHRFGAAHHFEPDRRHVALQPRRGGEGARSGRHRRYRKGCCHFGHRECGGCLPPRKWPRLRGFRSPCRRGHHSRPRAGRREPGHAERLARRGPVGAVQLVVHAVRPVLRPRARPRRPRAERHRVRPAAGRTTRSTSTGSHDQLHGADPGHDAVRRHRTADGHEHSPRRSSTRTRPTPRIPRTRSSCASTRIDRRRAGRHRQGRSTAPTAARPPGRRSRRRPRACSASTSTTSMSATCRCSRPIPTATSSLAARRFPAGRVVGLGGTTASG